MLDNSIVDVSFSSLFCWKAKTTRAFKEMSVREAVDVMGNKIEGNVVSFKSHVKFDACGQRITDLVSLEEMLVVSVSFIAMLTQNGRRTWISKQFSMFSQATRYNTSSSAVVRYAFMSKFAFL